MGGYRLSNCNPVVTYRTINPRFAKCPVIGFSYFKDFVFESSISYLTVISQWIFRYQISTVGIGRRPTFRPTFAVIIFSDNGIFVRVSKVFHINIYIYIFQKKVCWSATRIPPSCFIRHTKLVKPCPLCILFRAKIIIIQIINKLNAVIIVSDYVFFFQEALLKQCICVQHKAYQG